jgi:hypothetical protein
MLKDFVVLKNNGVDLKNYLEKSLKEVYSIEHIGNYVFEAHTSLGTIQIRTEPVDEEQTKMKILKMQII